MRKRDVKESRVRYIKKGTDGSSQKVFKRKGKEKEIEIQREIKERCSEGDRSSWLGQGIMVLLHF